MGCSPLGSYVQGTSQARILGWAAVFYPKKSSQPRDEPMCLVPPGLAGRFSTALPPGKPHCYILLLLLLLSHFSRVRLCATPWTAAHQAPPSLGFSRQEYWSGLPFPSPVHESEKVKVKSLSCVQLFETPWTAAYQAPPPMGFSRQEYWSGVPVPSPVIGNGEKLQIT